MQKQPHKQQPFFSLRHFWKVFSKKGRLGNRFEEQHLKEHRDHTFSQKSTGSPLEALSLTTTAAALAQRMPRLLLQAKRVATHFSYGQHHLRRAGWGETFWQYRPAQPGEPVTSIDWRQSARSFHAQVREREAESARTIALWCDFSASMRWRSEPSYPFKVDCACVLLLTMAALFLRSGEHVSLIGPTRVILPAHGPPLERLAMGLLQLANAAEAAETTCPTDYPALPLADHLPRYGHVLIASDFLCPEEQLSFCLNQIAHRPARASLLSIVDPAEIDFPYHGRVLLTGTEGETPLEISQAQESRHHYVQFMATRYDRLASLTTHCGHTLIQHRTDTSPLPSLLMLHTLLNRSPLR